MVGQKVRNAVFAADVPTVTGSPGWLKLCAKVGDDMAKKTVIATLLAFVLGGLSAFALLAPLPLRQRAVPSHSAWSEVQWPFAIDEWGSGKAFRCGVDVCGTEVVVHVRAKIGFCNCTTGVSDDDELDR